MLNSLSLDGTWKLTWSDGQRGRAEYAQRDVIDDAKYIDATVPGDVHLDVWKQGWIADPYVEHNVLSARWVEEMIWSYRRHLLPPPEALRGQCWLVFDGLDLVASVVLNGQEIGTHRNSFHPCRIDVTGKLREGTNILAVHLDSGLYDVADKPDTGYAHSPDSRLHKRHWLRKPQSEFGWDWSQRLINVGIAKSVRLEWTDGNVRPDQLVPLVTLSPDLTHGHLTVRWFIENLASEALDGELTLSLPETGQTERRAVQLKSGIHGVQASLDIEHPQLWWPVGHGDPHLYTIEVTLRIGGKTIDTRTTKIGFRHVQVDQSPHPASGSYFIIRINGRPIFCKGGNFVPPDMIVARVNRTRYERLIELALESNFNFLRVWGGGQYESDDFFDLCDEKGILVWHDFIFACGKFPTTDHAFHEDVKREVIFQIRRLASHPSLIVWCGNNEMESASWHWGPYQTGIRYPDYAFFHMVLPRLMAQEDPTRYYQPSSPMSPDGQDPDLPDRGDQHAWGVGFSNTDFRDYRKMICRFADEGGFLGPTSLPTMLACLGPEQRFVQSFDWQIHDNSIGSWGEPNYIDQITMQWLGKDCRKMSVEEYTYWHGLLHGEALREYCDNFHRRMFDSAAAIFWMFNDCWPTVRGWTTVDYYLRRTPAFHPLRRAMAPINVVVADAPDEAVVYGINETQHAIETELRFGLFNLAGGIPIDRSIPVSLPPNASTPLARLAKSEWTHPESSAVFAMLGKSGHIIARNKLFLPMFKDLTWASAKLSVRIEKGQAIFSSPTFVWGVCLDLNGEENLPDNFFDVYPDIPYVLPWHSPTPPIVRYVGNPS